MPPRYSLLETLYVPKSIGDTKENLHCLKALKLFDEEVFVYMERDLNVCVEFIRKAQFDRSLHGVEHMFLNDAIAY